MDFWIREFQLRSTRREIPWGVELETEGSSLLPRFRFPLLSRPPSQSQPRDPFSVSDANHEPDIRLDKGKGRAPRGETPPMDEDEDDEDVDVAQGLDEQLMGDKGTRVLPK